MNEARCGSGRDGAECGGGGAESGRDGRGSGVSRATTVTSWGCGRGGVTVVTWYRCGVSRATAVTYWGCGRAYCGCGGLRTSHYVYSATGLKSKTFCFLEFLRVFVYIS